MEHFRLRGLSQSFLASQASVALFYSKSQNLVDHQLGPVLDEEPMQCPSRTQLVRQTRFWKLLHEPLVHSVMVFQQCIQDKQLLEPQTRHYECDYEIDSFFRKLPGLPSRGHPTRPTTMTPHITHNKARWSRLVNATFSGLSADIPDPPAHIIIAPKHITGRTFIFRN